MDVSDLRDIQDTLNSLDTVKRLAPKDKIKWRDRCLENHPEAAGYINAIYRAATKES